MLFFGLGVSLVSTDQDWSYQRFAADGTPTLFRCALTLKNISDRRLTSQSVLKHGSQRSALADTGSGKITKL